MPLYEIKHDVVTKTGDQEKIVKATFEIEADSSEEAYERVRSACGRLFRRSGGDSLLYKGEMSSIIVNGQLRSGIWVQRFSFPNMLAQGIRVDVDITQP